MMSTTTSSTSALNDVNIENVTLVALDDNEEYLFIESLKDVAEAYRLDYNCEQHSISSTGSVTSKHDCSTDSYPPAKNQQSEREAIMGETKDTEELEINSCDETICRTYDESPGSPEEHPVYRKTIRAPISNGNMVHYYYCSVIFLLCAGNLLLRMLDLSFFCGYLKPSHREHISTKAVPTLATMAREHREVQSLTHQQKHPSTIQNLILELKEVANNLLLRQETRESRLETEIQKLVNDNRQLHNQLKKMDKLLERELKKGRRLKKRLQKKRVTAIKEREKWREVKKKLRQQHRTNVKEFKIQVKVERKNRRRLQKQFKKQEKLLYKERKERRRLQEKLNKQEMLAQKVKTEQTQMAGKRQLQEKLNREKNRLNVERKKRRDLEKLLKRLEWEYL